MKLEFGSKYSIVVILFIKNGWNSIKIQIERDRDIHPYPHCSCTYSFMQAEA